MAAASQAYWLDAGPPETKKAAKVKRPRPPVCYLLTRPGGRCACGTPSSESGVSACVAYDALDARGAWHACCACSACGVRAPFET